jgi:hypothetical protein
MKQKAADFKRLVVGASQDTPNRSQGFISNSVLKLLCYMRTREAGDSIKPSL